MLNVHEIFGIILVVGILALLLILFIPKDFDYLSLFNCFQNIKYFLILLIITQIRGTKW